MLTDKVLYPVYREIAADIETPVSAFLALVFCDALYPLAVHGAQPRAQEVPALVRLAKVVVDYCHSHEIIPENSFCVSVDIFVGVAIYSEKSFMKFTLRFC